MDAVEFLKAKNRMCREYGDIPEDCFACPIGNDSGGCQAGVLENQKVTEEILVQIVEKWAKEHPKKRRNNMDAVEYLRVKTRMCDSLKECGDCPLYKINNTDNINCFDRNNEEEAVEIVEKWAAEHPKKTRKNEFLKTFPNANPEDIDPCNMDTSLATDGTCGYKRCDDCRKEYWNEEVE